ncbi:MAG: hypothetical protein WC554_07205, partial [Clostridia bacterium]
MKVLVEVDMENSKIINLLAPDNDTDAATKKYVDDNIHLGDMEKADYDTNADNTVDSADSAGTALALVGIDAPTPLAGDNGKYL